MAFLSPYQPTHTPKAVVDTKPALYSIRLLDQHRRRVAIIEAPAQWRYTRRPSEATDVSLSLPREHVEIVLPAGVDLYAFLAPYQAARVGPVASTASLEPKYRRGDIGRYVEVYRGTQHIVTGRILKVDITDETITFGCLTEEIELEKHVTPAQYGRVYDHWDLADVARDMLHGWYVLRVKDQSQWGGAIEAVNVDIATEPGHVMLAKSGGRYVASGHITVRFKRDDVPDFLRWDRIRWASDNGAPVRTTMQYRYGDGSTMSAWSNEVEGALPDEIGIVPATTDAEIIDVRINLYTDDRDTEDDEGNPVGQTPFVFAVELIARTAGALMAGDIPAVAGVKVSGLDADGASAFHVLSQACAQTGWEFWVSDGKLNLAQEMGEDRTSSVLLRAGTNVSVKALSTGDDELVNILTAYGPGSGINRLMTVRRHEESIAQYGPQPGQHEFPDVSTLDDLIQAADEYLSKHAAPVPAYHVEVLYPYGTEPEFGCGDYVRVVDPRNGIVTSSRIAEEQREYSPAGLRTTLFLGVPAPDLARQVRPTPPPRAVAPPAKPEISVSPIAGGIRVVDTRAPKTKWLTTECHVSDQPDFERTAETLVENARKSRFDVLGLTPGVRYYAQLVRIDPNGNESVSEMRSAVAGDIPEPTPDLTPPATPTGLVAIPVVGGFVLSWNRHVPPPPLDRWILQRASSEDDYATWQTVNDEIRSALYTDVDALSYDYQYKYRLIAVSRAGIESLPSDETAPSTPGKVSLAEDVVDQLKREYLDQDFVSEVQDMQSRLGQAESGLQEAQNRLSGAEQRLDDAEGRLVNAETQLAEAENRLGTAEQRLTTAENQLVDARSRLTDAEGRLDEAEQALEQVEGVVQEHTVTLQTHAQEIAARVTQQVFDSLEQRVTDAEAELSIHAQEIQARVERTVFDALKSTVESHTATLQVHAQEIAARVTQEVFDILEATVSQHEATLQVHANAIAAKVEQIVFDALANRVSQAEAQLAVHADEIQARVKQEDFDDLEDRVTQAESTLTIHADQIATKVEQSVVDTLEGRVSQAETAIQQKADKIELTALSQEVDTIEQRVTTAETTLTQKADKIELNSVRQDLDQLSGTVATHEATLQTHAQQIAARVTQEVFNVLEGRVTQAEAELNILAGEIQARVEKTVFDTLAQTVAEHSATLDIHADEIAARVKQTVFDILEQRVTDAETTLQAHAGEIAARVTQTTFDALKRVVDSHSKTKPQGGILFPFDTTLFGTGGIKPLDSVATLRPGEGRFGGAVAVEEGTVNLCAESSYSAYATTNLGLVTMDTPHGRQEVFEFALSSGFSTARAHKSFSIEAGKTYTVSFVAKAEKPYARMSIGSIKFWPEGGAAANYTLGPIVSKELGNGWTYFSQSVSISSTNRDSMSLMAVMSGAEPGDKAWVYNFQAEEKPFATSFVDGTRAAGRLSYPVNFNMDEGTIRCYFYLDKTAVINARAGYPSIFLARQGTGLRNWFWVYFHDTRTYLAFQCRTDSGSISGRSVNLSDFDELSDGWHDVAIVWDHSSGAIRAYLDGEFKGTAPYDKNDLIPLDRIELGYRHDASGASNLLFDELLILPYAASEEEIRSWYEAQAPFYDPDDVAYTAGRVEQHEATLQIHAGQIASKVERSEFDQLSGRVTQAETAIQQKADQVVVTAIDNRLQTAEQNISGLAVTAQEISTAVANVQDGLTQAQSAIQQNANQIALRVQAVDENGNPATSAQLVIGQQDAQGRIWLKADQVLMEGSVGVRELSTLGGGTQVTDDGVKIIDGSAEVLRLGQVGGLPWGPDNSPLPARPGLWGDYGAGLYLRGYAALIDAGYAYDEDKVRIPATAVNPQIFVSAKEQLAYSPTHGVLTHQFVDAFLEEDAEGRFYHIKAKTLIRGQEYSWPSRPSDRGSWTYTQPQTAHPNGNKGVFTDFIICRPSWHIHWAGFGGYPISLRLEATNEFNANGDPINWKTLRTWSRAQPGEGILNWDTSLESYGQWAIRVRGESANPALVTYAVCGISKAGYRTGDEYLDVNGNKIIAADPANVPSGMSVLYLLLDKG